jgi:hypothetical protein
MILAERGRPPRASAAPKCRRAIRQRFMHQHIAAARRDGKRRIVRLGVAADRDAAPA